MPGFPVISLDEEIKFLKSVVIPSFDEDREFKTLKESKGWMKDRAKTYLSKEKAELLMDTFSTISTLDKAEKKLLEVKQENKKQQLSAVDGKLLLLIS